MTGSIGSATRVTRMDSDTKQWLYAAARRATQRYPGPIGELLSQELLSWMVFGHQLGSALIMRVAGDLLVEDPETTPADAATSPARSGDRLVRGTRAFGSSDLTNPA
jgi:hypothetical protein